MRAVDGDTARAAATSVISGSLSNRGLRTAVARIRHRLPRSLWLLAFSPIPRTRTDAQAAGDLMPHDPKENE